MSAVDESVTLPFGALQGTLFGVPAHSNRDDSFFSGEYFYFYNKAGGRLRVGYTWQCVAGARRAVLQLYGVQFGPCQRASEVFGMREVVNVETGATHPLAAFENGVATEPPAIGDIIVYPFTEKLYFGHIGMISDVDIDGDAGVIGIFEQNQRFHAFYPRRREPGGERCVARYVPIARDPASGAWRMTETDPAMSDCLGWMRVVGVARRPDPRAPLAVLPQFCFDADAEAARLADAGELPTVFRVSFANDRAPWRPTTSDDIAALLTPHPGMRASFFFEHGIGESVIGAATGVARVLRCVLRALFEDDAFAPLLASGSAATLLHDRSDASIAAAFRLPEAAVAAIRAKHSAGFDAPLLMRFDFALSGTPVVVPPRRSEDGSVVYERWETRRLDDAWRLTNLDVGHRTAEVTRDTAAFVEATRAEFAAKVAEYAVAVTRGFPSTQVSRGIARALAMHFAAHPDAEKRLFVVLTEQATPKERALALFVADVAKRAAKDGSISATVVSANELDFDKASGALVFAATGKRVGTAYVDAAWPSLLRHPRGADADAVVFAALSTNSAATRFVQPLWTALVTGSCAALEIATAIAANANTASASDDVVEFVDSCRRARLLASTQRDGEIEDFQMSVFTTGFDFSGISAVCSQDETIAACHFVFKE